MTWIFHISHYLLLWPLYIAVVLHMAYRIWWLFPYMKYSVMTFIPARLWKQFKVLLVLAVGYVLTVQHLAGVLFPGPEALGHIRPAILDSDCTEQREVRSCYSPVSLFNSHISASFIYQFTLFSKKHVLSN